MPGHGRHSTSSRGRVRAGLISAAVAATRPASLATALSTTQAAIRATIRAAAVTAIVSTSLSLSTALPAPLAAFFSSAPGTTGPGFLAEARARTTSSEATLPAVIEGSARARSLRLLTFNVEHQMSAPGFAAWQAFCEPHQWRDPIDPRTGRTTRPGVLTYCDALDGTDGRGNRLFAPLRSEADRQVKRDALRELISRARADVVLLQEIADEAAAREILGPDFNVATSAELSGPFRLAQNLAIGWRSRSPFQVGEVELVTGLSRAGPDGRHTRPGLAVTIGLPGGQRLALLNIHLKAGCRMGRLDEAPSRQPQRNDRRQADCRVFQEQIPPLEAWVDRKLDAGLGVIIAGDFNRDLVHEQRERMPARNDGSDPRTPVTDPGRLASFLAEISDEAPRAAVFTRARSGDTPSRSQCHREIDQFLVSRSVEAWLDKPLREHRVRVLGFAQPITLDRVRPSDHCPQLLVLGLGRGGSQRPGR